MKWSYTVLSELDIDEILEIEARSFTRPWSRLSFLSELAGRDAFSFGAAYTPPRGGEQIVGYLCFRVFSAEMHILKIAVSPEWRGQGVATGLIDTGIAAALKHEAVRAFLEVRPSNVPAVSFYRKLGFHTIGRRKNYYPETGEDALVMTRNLTDDPTLNASDMEKDSCKIEHL